MLTDHQKYALSQTQNRTTLYEIVATHEDGRKLLICYGPKSQAAILRALRSRFKSVKMVMLSMLPGDEKEVAAERIKGGWTLNGWTIRPTGRTQRECIIAGDAPQYVGGFPDDDGKLYTL